MIHNKRFKFGVVLGILMGMFLVICPFISPTSAQEARFSARTGISFHWWDDNADVKGEQLYVPIDLKASVKQFSFRVLTGYAYSYLDNPGEKSHHLSDLLDTKVNTSFVFELPWQVQTMLGLDLNLPTGRTNLHTKDLELVASLDPDLVPITSIGEGLNINPLIVLLRSFGDTDIVLGASYIFRGQYDYGSSYALQDYDPGDIQRYVVRLQFNQLDPLSLYLATEYTRYGTDELRDQDLYRPAPMWRLAAGLQYVQSTWKVRTDLNYFIRGKDRFREPGTFDLQNEEHNGYGDELNLTGSFHYKLLGDSTLLALGMGFLWIDDNDYPSSDSLFRGERTKLSASIGIDQHIGQVFILSGRLSGFTMHEEQTPAHPLEERSYRGYGISLFLTTRF